MFSPAKILFFMCLAQRISGFGTYLNVVILLISSSIWFGILTAAIVGYKGKTNFENYQAVANKLDADSPLPYCKLNFTEVAYDKANGTRVYDSLTYARSLFEDNRMAIAIGPYIDVFTSMQYVIQNQVHIVTSSIEKSEPTQRTFPILPDATSMSSAIAEFVKRLNWMKVAFLSQDDFAPVLSLSQMDIFVLPIQLPLNITSKNNTELRHTLTTLRRAHMEKFVLHSMDSQVVKCVMDAAEDMHLLHHSRQWFVSYLDIEDVLKGAEFPKSATIYGLQLLDPARLTTGIPGNFFKTRSRFEIAVLVDTVNMLRHFLSASSIYCSAEPEENKHVTSDDLKSKISQQDNPFVGALGAYRWKHSDDTDGQVKTNFTMNITRLNGHMEVVGNCIFTDSGPKLKVENKLQSAIEHRLEEVLNGKTFNVITRIEPPFIQINSNGGFEGFSVDILNEVANMMHFKYRIKLSEHSSPNTTWDDIIHELMEGKADVIIGSLDVRSAREEKISFSTTILDSSISLLLKKPPATPTFFQFLWPFTTNLWMTILLIFFVVGGALYLMGRYDSTQRQSEQQFDLKESLWYSLNVLLQGGTDYSPQTTSMRTIVAIYWFCTLIITTAYTANLAAFLTLKNIDNRVKTVEGLAVQQKTKYGVVKGSDVADFFANSDSDLYERMWTYMKLNEDKVIMPTRDEARQMAQNDGYVFLDDGVLNDHYAMEHCETLESIDQGIGSKQYSIGFPRGAPYRDDINRALLRLKESGSLDHIKDKWWVYNCDESEQEQTTIKSSSELEIKNMFGVFIILMGSVVLAVMVEIAKRIRMLLEKRYEKTKISKQNT